ncbi:hypothetical protein LSAT2_026731, partial [Lamellibrachia satsuma]
MTWYIELHRIGTNCAFDVITTDKIYRDHLVSSVLDEKVRDKLLEKRDLALEKALDIIRNSEVKAEVQFECDTRSQCNILPLSDYKLATGDTNLQNLTQSLRYTYGVWREESEGDGDHNTSSP